ncbi:hypothetical protein HPP92_011922 [Vanilla planifolia]|uniref:Pentatricopeptide repeat-containing protein n=1 Tax=Vanilla planifolia TaxID=51239 RepID=A0A835R531_VANPL|nr:hypothetical protein HPP92_011922 [Vanilla planifolia]
MLPFHHAVNLGRIIVTSYLIRSRRLSFKPSISFSILEDQLRKCQTTGHFLQIHAQMMVSGFIMDTFAASRLVAFSTNCSYVDLDYSRLLLHHIDYTNAFMWNRVMRACIKWNDPQGCLSLYKMMLKSDLDPDKYTHPIVVQACALLFSMLEGKQIHGHVLKFGFCLDVYVLNTLINMYSVYGDLEDARLLFDESPVLDSVSWNTMLAAYVQAGDVDNSLYFFNKMPVQNIIASNSMIALFGRNKRVEDARKLFDEMTCRDVVAWTAMITCYEQNEMYKEALQLFYLMKNTAFPMDEVVMVSVLVACVSLGAPKDGQVVHALIIRLGLEAYLNLQNALIHLYSSLGNIGDAQLLFDSGYFLDQISWNSMISGFLKCGFVDKAKHFFDAMPEKDLVSWSTMISGYAQLGHFSNALTLFHEMQIKGIRPDEATLVSVISACTSVSALEQGKWVHAYIRKHAIPLKLFLGTTLLDMYMKCGCIETAQEVFNEMEERGISTWNAMILGLSMNGLFKEALEKFAEMERYGVLPNEITFVGVLGACCHGGLVDEGRKHFNSMKHNYNLKPNIKHYGCMVDLLGRVGLLSEAEELIESMPMAPDVATWGALLGACRKHGNAALGERVGRKVIELEPKHDGFHVLLSNIYASKGKWDELKDVRCMMKQRKVIKKPGCSMIETNGTVHEFLSGDNSHPQMEAIKEMMVEMTNKLKMEGYEVNTTEDACDIENEKESSPYQHSEQLPLSCRSSTLTHLYQSVNEKSSSLCRF